VGGEVKPQRAPGLEHGPVSASSRVAPSGCGFGALQPSRAQRKRGWLGGPAPGLPQRRRTGRRDSYRPAGTADLSRSETTAGRAGFYPAPLANRVAPSGVGIGACLPPAVSRRGRTRGNRILSPKET
jgi:hypothetical protein